MSEEARRRRDRAVRPRLVWGGVAAALVGGVLITLGMMEVVAASGVWLVAGVAMLLAGIAVAARGGILFDTRTGGQASAELREIAHGSGHVGVEPGDMVSGPVAERAATPSMSPLARGARPPASVGSWSVPAGWILLLVTAFLVTAQGALVAHDVTGRSSSYRDVGLAILIGLVGMRLVVAPGHHPVSACLGCAAGMALVLGGWLADHDERGLAAIEVGCGVVTVAAAAAVVVGPRLVARSATAAGRRRGQPSR
ncbi:hypothetical protein SAMN04487968_10918 [Nocardioides terrae]|uniref:Uncharacterized protein n=2 Tax=Nocardioides terrae TaxID=574651 RepID=A0A1I1KUW5_9ACTN|nr:hypothetical protein SAMN04487968_10918 [Nocardioides terrae]